MRLVLLGALVCSTSYSKSDVDKIIEISNEDSKVQTSILNISIKSNSFDYICKHPARVKAYGYEEKLKSCEAYQSWLSKVDSVSLVFATGYLGNPASYFGHPLVKLNLVDSKTYLLDETLNYAAQTPLNENAFVYILKGLAGGYDSKFSQSPLYGHHQQYSEYELRDLWVYKLKLTKEQKENFLDLLYEVSYKKRDYFFLSINCASEVARILEYVYSKNLMPDYFIPHSIPIRLFHSLNDHELISNIELIPSRESSFTSKFLSLDESEREDFHKIDFNNPEFLVKKYKTKEKFLLLINDFYSYAFYLKKDVIYKKLKKRFLIAFLNEKVDIYSKDATISKQPPHLAEKPKAIRVGVKEFKNKSSAISIGYRAALYDSMNSSEFKPLGNELEVFSSSFLLRNNSFNIDYVNILSIQTLNTNQTGISDIDDFSWRAKLQYSNENRCLNRCKGLNLSAAVGKSFVFTKGLMYSLFGGNLKENSALSSSLNLDLEVGCFIKLNERNLLNFSYANRFDEKDTKVETYIIKYRYKINQRQDFRLEFKKETISYLKIEKSFYF